MLRVQVGAAGAGLSVQRAVDGVDAGASGRGEERRGKRGVSATADGECGRVWGWELESGRAAAESEGRAAKHAATEGS